MKIIVYYCILIDLFDQGIPGFFNINLMQVLVKRFRIIENMRLGGELALQNLEHSLIAVLTKDNEPLSNDY